MKVILVAVAFGCAFQAQAFVPYYAAGQHVMRWNVNLNVAHTNVVNPSTKKVRYFIASDTYSTTNRAAETNAVMATFDQWQSVPGSKLQFEFAGFVPPPTDSYYQEQVNGQTISRNVVYWAKSSLSLLGGTVNLSGRRGYTSVTFSFDNGSILDADIVLNGVQYQWFTDFNDAANQSMFIESVLLHEVGHFVGLDHTPVGGATVVNGGAGVSTEAGLSSDEVAAMRFLYPDPALKWASVKGRVTQAGVGVFGAMVVIEDAAGNIAGGTVSDPNGNYALQSLPGGTYKLRVSPFDPSNVANSGSLMRAGEIAPDYSEANTAFLPTAEIPITLANAEAKTQNVAVTGGQPAFRIASVSVPVAFEFASISRTAVSVPFGTGQTWYVGVSSPTLQSGSTLRVTGDGITHGATIFKPNFVAGVNALLVPITISNATPGLRSFVVTNGANVAYANGYLEIKPPTPDYNFDGLDDRFQRKYWAYWTSTNSSPAANGDGDLFSNRYEFETGTNPTNSASFHFDIEEIRKRSNGTDVIFKADPGRKYQLYSRPALQPEAGWQAVGTPVTATNSLMTITEGGRTIFAKFYRLQALP